MPASPVALLLYLALLIPGLVYVLVWERTAPHRRPTAFREAAAVVFVSVIAELVAWLLFLGFAALFPHAVPDVNRLIREGDKYAITHWVSLSWWGLALLALATAGAAGAAWWVAKHPHTSTQSAWWRLFYTTPKEMAKGRTSKKPPPGWPRVQIGCTLDDGSQWSGTAYWFNQLADETPDRDLILTAPLYYQQGQDPVRQLDSHAVCLSARHIRALRIRYEEALSPPEPPASPEEPESDDGVGSGSMICEEAGKGAAGTGGQATGTGWPPLT
ncbi:DUF6338 family protein [Nonomuraea endophytica]|uniref:DUF6338 family protein n=1 Tax=Nonomuraea endophytica TaxID=714136 RepID=UPI0037CBD665